MTDESKIYTKGGDFGETSLLGGTRVLKSHERVEAYGTLDELNSFIGLLRDQEIHQHYKDELLRIQNNLFTAEAWVARDPEKPVKTLPELHEEEIVRLEKEIDAMTAELPVLRSFILPGGHPFVSHCHIARTVLPQGRTGGDPPPCQAACRQRNNPIPQSFIRLPFCACTKDRL